MSYKCSVCGKSIDIIPCDSLKVYGENKPLCKSCWHDWQKHFEESGLSKVFDAVNKNIQRYEPIFSKVAFKWINKIEKVEFT